MEDSPGPELFLDLEFPVLELCACDGIACDSFLLRCYFRDYTTHSEISCNAVEAMLLPSQVSQESPLVTRSPDAV